MNSTLGQLFVLALIIWLIAVIERRVRGRRRRGLSRDDRALIRSAMTAFERPEQSSVSILSGGRFGPGDVHDVARLVGRDFDVRKGSTGGGPGNGIVIERRRRRWS